MAVVNTFEKGPEGWCSYDYHASIIASGYVWADHTRWSIDAPERPISILPFILSVPQLGRRAPDRPARNGDFGPAQGRWPQATRCRVLLLGPYQWYALALQGPALEDHRWVLGRTLAPHGGKRRVGVASKLGARSNDHGRSRYCTHGRRELRNLPRRLPPRGERQAGDGQLRDSLRPPSSVPFGTCPSTASRSGSVSPISRTPP